jgi:CheY-like chemotaxis protein
VVGFRIQPTTFEFPTPVDEKLPHFSGLRFLVIDDNADGRFLVSKTLLRKFPSAELTECQTADTAFAILDRGDRVSLIVCHRTFELDGASLVRELRRRNATVPILMMSGINRTDAALAAGATAFLTYEQWLMVGNHVASLLSAMPATPTTLGRAGSPSISRN